MAGQRAWFLNFDADLELAVAPQAYTSPRWVALRASELVARARALVPTGDQVLDVPRDDGTASQRAIRRDIVTPKQMKQVEGRAFCPTARAKEVWRFHGLAVPPTPTIAVLRRVNHRQFSAELGPTLPGARFVLTMDELMDVLRAPGGHRDVAAASSDWLLKRAFGFAGRGQRRLPGGVLDPTSQAFAERALGSGEGLQVEPLVERQLDVALHGFVKQSGALVLGDPTVQLIDARGAWQTTARAEPGALAAHERAQLLSEGERVGSALHHAGYFGPYGIDGFRWLARDGTAHFNARCDVNARYTMGWAVGMGDRRPDLQPCASW